MPKYDVCLSFAGENRDYVEEVARHLRDMGLRYFYDNDMQHELWGEELTEYLDVVYRVDSRFCVMFVSEDYVRKIWTIHERRSALSRGLTDPHSPYILPARFDDTEVPGIRPSLGFLDLRRFTPFQLAEMIAKKVGIEPGPAPQGWEYRTFVDAVGQGMRALGDKKLSHEMGFAETARTFSTDTESLDYYTARSRKFDDIVNSVTDLLSPQKQQWAFGPSGQAGNAEKIRLLATRFAKSYEDLLDWAADLRGTVTPARHRPLYEATARLADQPLKQIDEFLEHFAAAAERGAGELVLVIDYDSSEVEAELKKVQTT
ncbi:toll/interleukin-1 receptor domain-containing protein [Lentzea sp.]|uniref:toll/interleukin-1 receptor domain-containing protein n=1 Tax=Lentzea sp. TaxID=56099 RepID=UPI002C97CBA8|nr:TIR domain-containing protein [Lentzea sp.]HUQ57749.1 TIR domain-containing protein [Lentzea sp.]